MSMSHVQKVRLLYKTILRLHRGLPPALQTLGNDYVRDEFKRHKTCSVNESQKFMGEWAHYTINLAEQIGAQGKVQPIDAVGTDLDDGKLDEFREEQLQQLYELLVATKSPPDDSVTK